jgi:mono/diheme cytochrome c family protein
VLRPALPDPARRAARRAGPRRATRGSTLAAPAVGPRGAALAALAAGLHLATRAAALLAAAALLGGCGKLFPHRSQGEALYVENCADCHGMDGRGNTARCMGQPYADLTDDTWKNGGDDASVATSISEGSFGLMPAFQPKLDDQQVRALVAYIRVLHRRATGEGPR